MPTDTPIDMPAGHEPDRELDARELRGADRHPAITAAYAALPVGGSLVLVDDHDPVRLRDAFETDHPGGHTWTYLHRGPGDWRIRITKHAATALPRILTRTHLHTADTAAPDVAGAVWKLQVGERDLDSNIVALPPLGAIDAHTGPDLDVLIHVLAGTGLLTTEVGSLDLAAGDLLWLPRRSRRLFTAGPDGLRYLTVHRRRQALVLDTSRAGTGGDRR